MCAKRLYNKPFLTVQEQVDLLEKRGLEISDHAQSERYLRFINYYRISGYTFPFERQGTKRSHNLEGVSFEDIKALYDFDSSLRQLCWQALEQIEIAARTAFCYQLASEHGSHCFEKPETFENGEKHKEFLKELDENLKRSGMNEDFIRHYVNEYSNPKRPPSWMLIELMPFGLVSRAYGNLTNKEAKRVAGAFGLQRPILESWLHMLSYLRNLCAHHNRIWDRVFIFTPKFPKRWGIHSPEKRCHFALYDIVLETLLKRINSDMDWRGRIDALLERTPIADQARMDYDSSQWLAFRKQQ